MTITIISLQTMIIVFITYSNNSDIEPGLRHSYPCPCPTGLAERGYLFVYVRVILGFIGLSY